MKKTIIFFTVFLLAIVSLYFLINLRGEIVEEEITLEQTEESNVLRLLNSKEEIVLSYSIEEFKEWANQNWEKIFEETPRFIEDIEGTEVTPEDFQFFDKTSVLSPNKEKIAFSVHSYFVATHMSFIGIIDIKTEKIDLIPDKSRGIVESIIWSPEGTHISYALGTGRARGDYLSVDNVREMKKSFTLTGEDLSEVRFMPRFRELNWKENKLYFKTDHPEKEGNINWSVKKDGSELTKKY